MEDYKTDINSIKSIDPEGQEKKGVLKEKIAAILEFLQYKILLSPDAPDVRKFLESNPTEEEKRAYDEKYYSIGELTYHNNPHAYDQLCFVIIGEQSAVNEVLYFESRQAADDFVSLVRSTGIMVEVKETTEFKGFTKIKVIYGRTQNDVRMMEDVLESRHDDLKYYEIEYGRLMGYPETAIQAYAGNATRLKHPKTPRDMESDDGRKYTELRSKTKKLFGNFAFSKDHAGEELNQLQKRNDKLREYAPQLFTKL